MSLIVPSATTGKTLTPKEAKLLALHRGGMSLKEIATAWGLKSSSGLGGTFSAAVEKERILLLRDRSPRNNNTSLRRARGVSHKVQ